MGQLVQLNGSEDVGILRSKSEISNQSILSAEKLSVQWIRKF